ncbi:T9SS type A sorting domain-containing protein [candidate division WOR-3 bacterium]|nr:T9SS type A sorting domain-containing protein [candidate division WOR-3 bacterium]
MRKLVVWLLIFLPALAQAEIRWRELHPLPDTSVADTLPFRRGVFGYVFDKNMCAMVIYGGHSDLEGAMSDCWALDLSTSDGKWKQLRPDIDPSPPPPGKRLNSTMIYDPLYRRNILFAGRYGIDFNDCWAVDSISQGGRFTELEPSLPWPDSAEGHTAVYDTLEKRMIVSGGFADEPYYQKQCWALDLTTWNGSWDSLPSMPLPRAAHSAIYDQANHQMIIFGGAGLGVRYKDCWSLDLTTYEWTKLDPDGSLPESLLVDWCEGINDHTAIYDPVHKWMILFGGDRNYGSTMVCFLNECWALDLSMPGKERWLKLNIEGERPLPRAFHGAIYDPYYKRMVIFGGSWGLFKPVQMKGAKFIMFDDVWELSLDDVLRDVGVESIACPESVWVDSTYVLKATVKNFGEVSEAFYVRCVIDTGGVVVYDKTKFTNEILPDSTSKVGFYYWKVSSLSGVTYNIKVFTTLWCDTVPSNDTAYAQVLSVGVEETEDRRQETEVRLYEAYPNPFSKETVIRYSLPVESERVSLGIYDLSGRLIRSLVDGPINHLTNQPFNQVVWDGGDELGKKVPSGIYFYKLTCGDFKATKKLLLIR